MLTAAEKTKFRLIKEAALQGRATEVSRADKQWMLDIFARTGRTCKAEVLQAAAKEGYNVNNIPALIC